MSQPNSGSNAQAGAVAPPANPPAGSPPAVNATAKISVDQALAENEALHRVLKEKDDMIGELTKQLKAANDVLEGQTKAKLIGEILPRSSFTVEDLSVKSLEELQQIRLTLDQAKLPSYKNVRFGSPCAGIRERTA